MHILNIAAYRFVALSNLEQLRAALKMRALALGLKGTILLAGEGINLLLAGPAANVEAFVRTLRETGAARGRAPLQRHAAR